MELVFCLTWEVFELKLHAGHGHCAVVIKMKIVMKMALMMMMMKIKMMMMMMMMIRMYHRIGDADDDHNKDNGYASHLKKTFVLNELLVVYLEHIKRKVLTL